MKLNKVDEAVIAALKPIGKELTLQEIEQTAGVPAKKIFKSLKKLFECEMVDSRARKYRLITDKVPTKSKDKESAETE